MKELLILVCVLLISWCISKMMPEVENDKELKMNWLVQFILTAILTFVVLFRYYSAFRPFISIGLSLVVFGIVNVKDWIQLIRKKDLVY